MLRHDFEMFRQDPALLSLQSLSLPQLHEELVQRVPAHQLDVPPGDYQVCNLRYSPGQKLVIGLTAESSARPIGIRIFPPSQLESRYRKARRSAGSHVHSLPSVSALAWVFPAERKLDLQALGERSLLTRLWRAHRQLELTKAELVHFVPEHALTMRLHGQPAEGHPLVGCFDTAHVVSEYLKVSYDHGGSRVAARTRCLAEQCQGSRICLAQNTCYLPDYRLMFQSALDHVPGGSLSAAEAAGALAQFHTLQLPEALLQTDMPSCKERIARARNLLQAVFPQLLAFHDELARRWIHMPTRQSPVVLLHGDAHPGNLFRLRDGRIGIIDLDRVHRGAAVEDLATLQAFRLWKCLQSGEDTKPVMDEFENSIDAYDDHTARAIDRRAAYHTLALHLLTDRISRGIARGKVQGAAQILQFMELSNQALDRAGHR